MQIPITTDFNQRPEDVVGSAEFTEEGLNRVSELIEMGVMPQFAIGFTSDVDEEGNHTNVKLVEISMITRPPEEEA